MQARQTGCAAVFGDQPARGGVVEGVDDELGPAQQLRDVALSQLPGLRCDLYPRRATEPRTQHLRLVGAHITLVIELRADVVCLHAVTVDYRELPHALAHQIIGQVRAERARPTDGESCLAKTLYRLGPAKEPLV